MALFGKKKNEQADNDFNEALAKLSRIADEAEKDPIARELHEEVPVDGRAYQEDKEALFDRLKTGMTRTRENFSAGLASIFTASEIDDDFYDELEEILIMADIGVNATMNILEDLKKKVKSEHLKKTEECREYISVRYRAKS